MKTAIAIFSVIATLGLFGIWISWSAPKNQTQNEHAGQSPAGENGGPEKDVAKKSGGESYGWRKYKEAIERNEKFITAISTIFIAGFTVALAFATLFLWLATRNLVEDAKHNSERQLRAYVFVKPDKVPSIDEWFTRGAVLKIINSGQTPAYKIRYWIAVDYREYPLATELAEPTAAMLQSAGQTRSVLNPGVTTDLPIRAGREPAPEQKAAIVAGTHALYVYGQIDYTDAFGIDRISKFRLEFKKESIINSVLAWAPEGNDAD